MSTEPIWQFSPSKARMYVAAINGAPTTGTPDQVTISAGDCIILA